MKVISARHSRIALSSVFMMMTLLLTGCFSNDPYPEKSKAGKEKVLYTSYQAELPFMDIASAYNVLYSQINAAICEPPFDYHYLKRPVELMPLTAAKMPESTFYDKAGEPLPNSAPADQIARIDYVIEIKKGIQYQDHPCFAKDSQGNYLFHLGPDDSFRGIDHMYDLLDDPRAATKTRELIAADFVYQMKRMANPINATPIGGVLEKNILGFSELKEAITEARDALRLERKNAAGLNYNQSSDETARPLFLNMHDFDCKGIQVLDRYRYKVSLKTNYPQFVYWMTMNFFAPIPWEVQRFYCQHAAAEKRYSLDNYPIGTGPFRMADNQTNYRVVLEKNDNFRGEPYPSEGSEEDRKLGLLDAAGQTMPFLDKVVYMLDREGPPRWTKFIQGYYDHLSLIKSDTELSNQVMQLTPQGGQGLSPEMAEREIGLSITNKPFIRYYAFNMTDPVFGGYEESKCKLRQAVSIAMDMEKYIQIFQNGRGELCHGIIPSSMLNLKGKDLINPYIYKWNEEKKKAESLGIEHAKKLMAEAGYANGKDKDGNQLVLYYDTIAKRGVKGVRDWMNKQLSPLGIRVEMRDTDSNRWREKVKSGNYQFMDYGWFADYPDPENFAFLLYGPNSKAKFDGENYANYDSTEYNRLFKQMETMPNGPRRDEIVLKMMNVARHDAPWVFAWEPSSFTLNHHWLKNVKPPTISSRVLKYMDLDVNQREASLKKWNLAITWPVYAILILILTLMIMAWVRHDRSRKRGQQL